MTSSSLPLSADSCADDNFIIVAIVSRLLFFGHQYPLQPLPDHNTTPREEILEFLPSCLLQKIANVELTSAHDGSAGHVTRTVLLMRMLLLLVVFVLVATTAPALVNTAIVTAIVVSNVVTPSSSSLLVTSTTPATTTLLTILTDEDVTTV
jgi:hypothetical protein